MKDLAKLMQLLYKTNDYYVKIESEESYKYEDNYWGKVVDPDGKKRNLLNETEKQIEDTRYIWEFINKQKPGIILDVGCGLGSFLSAIDDRWEKYGIEISEFASEHAKKYGKIHIGTLFDFPYKERSFDIITMNHVIEYVDDPEGNVQVIKSLLKNNGILIIGTPDFDSGCARRFGNNYRLLDPGHIRLFSNDSMHRFLRDNGFHIFKAEYPFFNTRYFSKENLLRLFDISKVSPPFYGNFMTFFCKKNKKGNNYE